MSTFWIVAVLLLWVLMIALSVTVLGLLRRIGPVLERAETQLQASPFAAGGVPPGTAVSAFKLTNADGMSVTSDELFSTPALVLFMSSACDPCRALAADLGKAGDQVGGVPLSIVLEDSKEARRFPVPPQVPVLYQVDQAAASAFENNSTPQVFLVDKGGVVLDSLIPDSLDRIRRLVEEHMEGGGRRKLRTQEASV